MGISFYSMRNGRNRYFAGSMIVRSRLRKPPSPMAGSLALDSYVMPKTSYLKSPRNGGLVVEGQTATEVAAPAAAEAKQGGGSGGSGGGSGVGSGGGGGGVSSGATLLELFDLQPKTVVYAHAPNGTISLRSKVDAPSSTPPRMHNSIKPVWVAKRGVYLGMRHGHHGAPPASAQLAPRHGDVPRFYWQSLFELDATLQHIQRISRPFHIPCPTRRHFSTAACSL